MDRFTAEFSAIDSDTALQAFVSRWALSKDGIDQRPGGQVYGVYAGLIEGRQVRVTHRWHDPSQAFSIQPDVAKVDLDLDGARVCTVDWVE